MLQRFLDYLSRDDLPVIKEMPPHVRDLQLNFPLIALQMASAHLPNEAVNSKAMSLQMQLTSAKAETAAPEKRRTLSLVNKRH